MMANIMLLISIMFLSSYLTAQASLLDRYKVNLNSAGKQRLMLLGTRGDEAASKSKLLYKIKDSWYVGNNKIHKEFDARKHWPKCKTIGEVHNDGNSNLSWAYATAGAFADRMCIETNGSYNQLLSTEELISCSGIKNNPLADDQAWKYFKSHGLVSGGKYNTNDGCQPSKFPEMFNSPANKHNRTCHKDCYGNKTIDYKHDHVKISHSFAVLHKNIQREVQAYGPVSAHFLLYDDLFLNKNGVYAKTEKAKLLRDQFAKLIGWGVENGEDYWLLVHSWGYDWGQQGVFKIKRGTNECLIESCISGGVPKIK